MTPVTIMRLVGSSIPNQAASMLAADGFDCNGLLLLAYPLATLIARDTDHDLLVRAAEAFVLDGVDLALPAGSVVVRPVPDQAALALALGGTTAVQAQTSPGYGPLQISWEVRNRFRLFSCFLIALWHDAPT